MAESDDIRQDDTALDLVSQDEEGAKSPAHTSEAHSAGRKRGLRTRFIAVMKGIGFGLVTALQVITGTYSRN